MRRIRSCARASVRIGLVLALTSAGFALTTATSTAPAPALQVQPANASVTSIAIQLAAPVVGVAATPTGHGYWRAALDGGVLTAGDAHFYGAATGHTRDAIVGLAATRSGHGYWLVDRSGGVYPFGDAVFRGSMAGHRLSKPVVGIAATPDGKGYWLVASDGGIFAFNAAFHGSTGAIKLNKPIVGMAATPDGKGYWLVASDGGVFAFNARFLGSTGAIKLNKPVVGMAAVPTGAGYTLVGADGGLFRFGSVPFYGSAANACPGAPAVGVTQSPGAIGYWITFANAQTYAFSPSTKPPTCTPSGTGKLGMMASDLFVRANQERSARGLPALKWDPSLASYAAAWSANMKANGFRHSDIGSLLGPYDFVGENIAAGSKGVTTGGLHDAWMHSDGHRSNLLSPGFTRVGMGAYCGSDGSIWLTEDFGRAATEGPPPPSAGVPPVDPIVRSDNGNDSC